MRLSFPKATEQLVQLVLEVQESFNLPHSRTRRILYFMPKLLKLCPCSGGLIQNPSSLRRHETMASTAFSTATSTPLSLTKNVVPYFPDRRVQKTLGRANLTPSPTLKLRTFPLPPN